VIAIFQLPDDQFVTDGRVRLPEQGSVNWRREYPVDEAKTIYRVAPIFPDAASAVAWLETIIEDRRQDALEGMPRERLPFGGLGSAYEKGFFEHNQPPGIGYTHQYEGYLQIEGQRLESLLFRGDISASYRLMPTHSRYLLSGFVDGAVSRAEAIEALHAAGSRTSSFVENFFLDRDVQKQFPFVKGLPISNRAAIARHYGFSSWILDFTVDPAIAAFFATGADATPPKNGELGSFWVVDESYLEELLGEKPFIELNPGHESRMWGPVDIATMRVQAGRDLEKWYINRVGAPDFWDFQAAELDEGFYLGLHYAPGLEVERMWQQKWCGVEPFPPIGDLPPALRKGARQLGDPSYEYILNTQFLFQRLCSRVYFKQSGKLFELPERGITAAKLLPRDDDFLMCVENYNKRQGLT